MNRVTVVDLSLYLSPPPLPKIPLPHSLIVMLIILILKALWNIIGIVFILIIIVIIIVVLPRRIRQGVG